MHPRLRTLSLSALLLLGAVPLADAAPAAWPDLTVAPSGAAKDGANDAALIVAIEDYYVAPDVPGARDNAAAWKAYLKDVRGVSVVKTIEDAQASKEGMLEAAAAVRARVKPGGRAWLVYIGHGAPSRSQDEGLLVGADAQQSASSLYARSLPQSELLRALGAEEGVPVVAVLDACFSGSTGAGRIVEGLQPLLPTSMLRTASTATVLSAGRADQFAGPLPGLGRPAFSYLALGALRGWGDANADGAVTAQEVVNYASDRLVELVDDRTQEPQVAGKADAVLGKGKERAPDLEALARSASVAVAKPIPAAPVSVSGGGTGAGVVDDDVAALLRVKELKAAREAKLTELAAAKQSEAAAAWSKLSSVLSDGSAEEIAAVEKFVATWSAAKVWVEDAEGRHERVVAVAAVDGAKGWLGKARGTHSANSEMATGSSAKGAAARQSSTLGAMKWIPAGTFMMGSPSSEAGRYDDEGPQHQVTLTTGFWMMEHEVTQGEWQAVMGSNPSRFSSCGPTCPIEWVSWELAVEFAKRVSTRDGVQYRLPTEAEWEYAARGGQSYVYAGSNEAMSVGWIDANSGGKTHAVCGMARNGYGLCDMTGNVWEWTADVYGPYASGSVTDPAGAPTGPDRVARGGSWNDTAADARAALRGRDNPGGRDDVLGFRLVRTSP